MRLTVLVVGALGAAACQTYDFEPVTPLAIAQTVKEVNIAAKPLKPALFLVVDKSGSMGLEVSPGVKRIDAMKSAMGTFLTQAGSSAHLGMLPYPASVEAMQLCAGGDIANVATAGVPLDEGDEDDARLGQVAMTVKSAIDGLQPGGGTPTNATMRSLTTYQPLLSKDRDRFAVLLTDGLPNCNDELDPQLTTCTCTQPKGSPTSACQASDGMRLRNQCLDDQGSAAAVDLLNVKGVRTIVIGFGADVANPLGAATLAQMAAAGGFTRPCKLDSDCNAGDTCSPGGVDPCGRPASTCGQSYFQAGNAAELGRVLQAIKDSVTCPPCLQVITAPPSDPSLISVIVDGAPTQSGPDTWQYRDNATAPGVEFVGALCSKLMNSTTLDPVRVEIRTIEAL